jgi:hypothetical protein
MFSRNFTQKEIATAILNEDNPKTMDYFYVKLLGVKIQHTRVMPNGRLVGAIQSQNHRTSEAFGLLHRHRRQASRGQLYFALDIHAHQIFPKSRSLRICSRKSLPVAVVNPIAGQTKIVMYGTYASTQTEPDEILLPKDIVCYCRNAWERKGEIKPSRVSVKDNDEETTAIDTPISVI